MKLLKIIFVLSVIVILLGCASTTKVFKPLDKNILSEQRNLNYGLMTVDSDNAKVPRHLWKRFTPIWRWS
jgi:hypothetical protein